MEEESAPASAWGVIGHQWAIDLLRRSLLTGRQRHGYLISGAPSLGKRTLALAFASALNCDAAAISARPCGDCRACRAIGRANDPDLIVADGEKCAPLKIDAIRELTRLLSLKPYVARYRIAILADFDLVAPLAQDALLKTLEEPAADAILIVLASSAERVLPTIRSRAQSIPLRTAPLELLKAALVERGCEEERADLIARLSGGRTGWALAAMRDDALLAHRGEMLDMLRDLVAGGRLGRIKRAEALNKRFGKDKAAVRGILEIWQTYWRDVLLQCHDSPVKPCNSDRADEIRTLAQRIEPGRARAGLEATRRTIDALSTNANVRLALDALFLDYPGLE
jgi:DNA polymerase-3 subunit delta'